MPDPVIDNDIIGQVYPNPANKEQASIDVIGNKTGSAEMVLCNLAGIALKRQQLQLKIGRNEQIINTNHFANGMYILKVDVNSAESWIIMDFFQLF